jgi:ribosomal protein S18 acetylase RimI-like enzyme
VSEWRITRAVRDDAAPLARILGDWIREVGWMPILHSRDDDVGFLAGLIGDKEVLVARDADGAMGFLALGKAEIPALYLAPRARGRGVGKALLDAAKAMQPHLSLWVFQANGRAVEFYLREGFHEMSRTDGKRNAEGLPDLRLIWRRPE